MEDYLTVALMKGRPAEQALKLFKKAGINFSDFHEKSRKLVVIDDENAVRLILVKAVDVPTYVEKGAADIGIVGKDTIMEDPWDVYELLDLGIGKCKMAVAGFPGSDISNSKTLTVASKYPSIANAYFKEKGIRTDTIKLNGSIELAPLIGMSDCIVDIVETGTTLKENGLVVLENIADISARLIANKASYATKTSRIQQFVSDLKAVLE